MAWFRPEWSKNPNVLRTKGFNKQILAIPSSKFRQSKKKTMKINNALGNEQSICIGFRKTQLPMEASSLLCCIGKLSPKRTTNDLFVLGSPTPDNTKSNHSMPMMTLTMSMTLALTVETKKEMEWSQLQCFIGFVSLKRTTNHLCFGQPRSRQSKKFPMNRALSLNSKTWNDNVN